MSESSNIVFSVIIPTYNRALFITESIESILAQTYIHFELIIVDDGSTDATEQIVRNFNDTRIKYFKKKHSGVSATRNYGVEKSTGDMVCFLDSDDILLNNHFEVLINNISQHEDKELIYRTKYKSFPEDDFSEMISFNPEEENRILFALRNLTAIHTYCIPASIVKTIKFDERFHYFEDTSFIVRALFRCKLNQINQTTVVYRNHALNSTANLYQSEAYEDSLYNTINSIKALFEEHRNELKLFNALAEERNMIAKKYLEHGHMAVENYRKKTGLKLLMRSIQVKFLRNYITSYLSLIVKSIRYCAR